MCRIGNGLNTATAPVWQTETTQARWRGHLVILELGLNVGGYCVVNWINYGLSFHEGSIAWRLPIALQFVFMILLFAIIPWLPESPRSVYPTQLTVEEKNAKDMSRWLMSHNRAEEAREVLACIEARSIEDPFVAAQQDEIKYNIQYEHDNATPWRKLLWSRTSNDTKTLRRLVLGAGTQAIQQFQGLVAKQIYSMLKYLTIYLQGLT